MKQTIEIMAGKIEALKAGSVSPESACIIVDGIVRAVNDGFAEWEDLKITEDELKALISASDKSSVELGTEYASEVKLALNAFSWRYEKYCQKEMSADDLKKYFERLYRLLEKGAINLKELAPVIKIEALFELKEVLASKGQ